MAVDTVAGYRPSTESYRAQTARRRPACCRSPRQGSRLGLRKPAAPCEFLGIGRTYTPSAPMFPWPTMQASMVRPVSASLQHRHLLVSELQRGCSHVLLKVRDRRGAWDGHHRGRVPKEPGERHLRWGGLVAAGDRLERTTRSRQPPSGQRVPGHESYLLPLAGLQHRLRGAVGEVVAVLDRGHRHYVQRDLQLPHAHVRKSDLPYLALLPELR